MRVPIRRGRREPHRRGDVLKTRDGSEMAGFIHGEHAAYPVGSLGFDQATVHKLLKEHELFPGAAGRAVLVLPAPVDDDIARSNPIGDKPFTIFAAGVKGGMLELV